MELDLTVDSDDDFEPPVASHNLSNTSPQNTNVSVPELVFDGDEVVLESSQGTHEPEVVDLERGNGSDSITLPSGGQERSDTVSRPRLHIALKKKGARGTGSDLVCHVCGKRGHNAGFNGAEYQDCPNRPCYLCKREGHTTRSCPYRVMPEIVGVTKGQRNVLLALRHRERFGSRTQDRIAPASSIVKDWVIDAAMLNLHSRRVSVAEFHPQYPLVITGDKYGEIGTWNYQHDEDMSWRPHNWLVTGLKFNPHTVSSVYTSSVDGLVLQVDLDTQQKQTLFNANPGQTYNAKTWKCLYSIEYAAEQQLLLTGDAFGVLHAVDRRDPRRVSSTPVHLKNKVTCISANPRCPHLILTCGNDHHMTLWDLRKLQSGSQIDDYRHPRVVNSAYWSPVTGNKIASTCIDNRIRVWDNGGLSPLDTPSRTIVHSHDFSRYLSPFKAVWDPKDRTERLLYCGRYISEVFNDVALHPVDIIDASGRLTTGQSVIAQMKDPLLTTICPVTAVHPSKNLVASGSSRNVYLWRPELERDASGLKEQEPEEQPCDAPKAQSRQPVPCGAGGLKSGLLALGVIPGKKKGKRKGANTKNKKPNQKPKSKPKPRQRTKGKQQAVRSPGAGSQAASPSARKVDMKRSRSERQAEEDVVVIDVSGSSEVDYAAPNPAADSEQRPAKRRRKGKGKDKAKR